MINIDNTERIDAMSRICDFENFFLLISDLSLIHIWFMGVEIRDYRVYLLLIKARNHVSTSQLHQAYRNTRIVASVRYCLGPASWRQYTCLLYTSLSNKEYITETLAMPIRGEETRTFSLDSLFNRNSRTATEMCIRDRQYTLLEVNSHCRVEYLELVYL